MTNEFVKATCKPGQQAATCRYLGCGADGWVCMKLTDLAPLLDSRAAEGSMSARADNCPGVEN
jgi:hypothetical protein